MHTSATRLGLIQIACLTLGFFALGGVLKLLGYPDDNPLVEWSPLAAFLRDRGLLLLLIPGLWVIYAAVADRSDRGIFSARAAFMSGIAISGIFIKIFLFAAVFPIRRIPMIRSTTQSHAKALTP